MLHMTPEQYAAHQKRVQQARLVVGSASARTTPEDVEKPAKLEIPTFVDKKNRKIYCYEDMLHAQLEKRGITGFEREYRWLPDRKYRADLANAEKRVLVEVQGHAHRIKGRFESDIRKYQDALLNGWTLIPVLTSQVRRNTAAEIIERALNVYTN